MVRCELERHSGLDMEVLVGAQERPRMPAMVATDIEVVVEQVAAHPSMASIAAQAVAVATATAASSLGGDT
jgi:hypothetical protein